MAIHPYRVAPRLIASNSGSGYSSSNSFRGPFGPGMAEDIFKINYCDEAETAPYPYDEYENHSKSLPDEEYWYQTELPLKNVSELETELRNEIRKWERAYNKVMIYALKWHYLLEEVEENPQVKKMFQDLQMIRKLGGSDRV